MPLVNQFNSAESLINGANRLLERLLSKVSYKDLFMMMLMPFLKQLVMVVQQ